MKITKRYIVLASHNQRMNARLFRLALSLDAACQTEDKGAFFGSILGTLNHIIFGNYFLLTRVRALIGRASPLDAVAPQWDFQPDKQYGASVAELAAICTDTDQAVCDFVSTLDERDLSKETDDAIPLWALLDQLFQHQTHHRGQATTLLSQFGVDYPSFADVIGTLQGESA
jgi:uncharacterized damage-inducible protein DinB